MYFTVLHNKSYCCNILDNNVNKRMVFYSIHFCVLNLALHGTYYYIDLTKLESKCFIFNGKIEGKFKYYYENGKRMKE
jgi:antitoxin component YwqK of YwqJK toxin-antitoxin module